MDPPDAYPDGPEKKSSIVIKERSMSLTVWAGAPDSFIRLDGDGVGRDTPVFPACSPPKEKGPDDNLTLSFWHKKFKNPATS
jgi:hypothetical protein